MRRLALAVLALPLVTPPGAAAHACERDGYRTVRKSSDARVLARGRAWWGCLTARDRLVRLDRPDVREQLYGFGLAGRYVAFVASGVDGAEAYDSVVAQDLRGGEVVRSAGVTTTSDDPDDTGTATELRVTARGYLAWIACRDGGCHGTVSRQVLRFDSRGKRLLDHGPLIRRHSLRLARRGTRVTWTRRGRRRVATLR